MIASMIASMIVHIRGWVRKFCHRCYNFVNRHDRLLYYTFIKRKPASGFTPGVFQGVYFDPVNNLIYKAYTRR